MKFKPIEIIYEISIYNDLTFGYIDDFTDISCELESDYFINYDYMDIDIFKKEQLK